MSSHLIVRPSTIILLFALSLGLGVSASVLNGGLSDAWWLLGITASAAFLLILARFIQAAPNASTIVSFSFVVALVALATATWRELVFDDLVVRGDVLFFPNINLLAASLAVMSISTFLLGPKRFAWPLLLIGASAMVLTGSRTAMLAFGLALIVLLAVTPKRRLVAIGGPLLVLTVLIALVAVAWSASSADDASVNLLHFSNDYQTYAWRTWGDSSVTVSPFATAAPSRFRWGSRIVGQTGETSRLLFYASAGTSLPEVPYVASVYLRANEPQKVILSSHLSQVTCYVDRQWQRCVTPAGIGDGRLSVQLRLETVEPGQRIDLYMWGAQLELGETATALEERGRNRFAIHMANRFNKDPLWLGASRDTAFSAAWEMFRLEPLAGIGLGHYRERFDQVADVNGGVVLNHAHNLPLQLLAETGILGFLSWAIPFFGVLALGWRRHWRRLLPLVVAVLVLNTFDFTFYSNGVYYVYWLTVGLILFSPRTEVELGAMDRGA